MSTYDAVALDGSGLDLGSNPVTFNYNGDGTVNYIQTSSSGHTYRQTFNYTSSVLTSITSWVKQ